MLDTNLAALIGRIDDDLSKYCYELNAIFKRETKGRRQGFIITPADKSYPMGADFESIINDQDNVYIPETELSEIELYAFQEKCRWDFLMIAKDVISDIKNNIISLSYTDLDDTPTGKMQRRKK